jgi:RimJ/RimL family protein N-acetyltransferase
MRTITRLPAIETVSLVIREIEPRDADGFCAYMMLDSYQRHIAMRLRSEAEVQAFVTRSVARQGEERRNLFHLAAEEKRTGRLIGDGFLIMQRPKTVEIGWGLHPALWRKGLGTEMGEALLGLAFERLGADTAWCKVMGGNAASAALARRIGMSHLTAHADYPTAPGHTSTVDFYSLSASGYFDLTY